MQYKVPLAWLQLTHNKGRFLVTLAGVTFAVILMFMQLGFKDALYEDAITIHKSLKADLVLISPKSTSLFGTRTFTERRLYDALKIPGVATASPFYQGWSPWKNPEDLSSRDIAVLAFDPDKPVFNLPEVEQHLDIIRRRDVVLFDRLSRAEYGPVAAQLTVGNRVSTEINSRQFEVKGLFELGGGIMTADGLLIASDLNFLRITGDSLDRIDLGLLMVEPGFDPQQVSQQLKTVLPQDVTAITKQEFLEFEQNYWKNSSPIGFVFGIGTAMGFFIGAVIVYQILYTDITNHLAEYATLKAMGYADIYLLKVVLQEAILLAILGFIPGLIVSISLYDFTRNAARLPMATNLERVVFILSLTILMCFVSGAIAMNKLRAVDPADIF
ncbi:MAG: ABC transporter permease DevC [Cyanobacteria bacterium J06643_13]